MRRSVSILTLLSLLCLQLLPFVALAADTTSTGTASATTSTDTTSNTASTDTTATANPTANTDSKNTSTLKDFDVAAPTQVNVNEAFDVTVKALDASGKVIPNYDGTIYFDSKNSPNDIVFPFQSGEYKFIASDQGVHTFAKGYTLKKAGDYELDIFELDTPGDGISKTLKVTAVDKNAVTTWKEPITITEPVDQITVSDKTIPVGGTTKATSSVNILLNGKKVVTVQTDTDGKFSTNVGELTIGDNTLVAEVLDGSGAVVGTSVTTQVKYSTETPKLTSLTIKEGTEFLAGSTINLIALGDQNLKTVQIKIGDQNAILEEDKNNLGTYTGVFKTSEFEGEFKATAEIESQLGVKAEIKDMTSFKTVATKIENVKVETTSDKKARFTFDLTPDVDQIVYFKVKYGTETGKYTKESLTYEKSKIKENGKYTWYIPNLQPGEYFSTIIGVDKDKNETAITSGEQTFTLALDAAPTCTVDKISGLRLESKTKSYSILTWDPQKDASTYQIFKKDSSGDFSMIDEITDNKYQINIDTGDGQTVFEDFRVRGICKNGSYVGQGDFSESVSVQTGPELIVFFALFMASGIALILIRRGYLN